VWSSDVLDEEKFEIVKVVVVILYLAQPFRPCQMSRLPGRLALAWLDRPS
jgi:hypothetical protein